MLKQFSDSIVPNISPLEGNSIEDDERVSFAVVTAASIGNQIQAADWSDSVIERCRFNSTVITDSRFDRIAILDCDLSGVTFVNCLLRECLIMGVKSKFHLGLDNCIVDNVMVTRSHIDHFEIRACQIAELDLLGVESPSMGFHQCQPYKKAGQVSIEECEIEKISGLDVLGEAGIVVQVDTPMWRDLGDYYLKEKGFQQHQGRAASTFDLLDNIGEGGWRKA